MKSLFILLLAFTSALTACTQSNKLKPEAHLAGAQLKKFSQATFAAGCFWHEEAMFESIKGVKEVESGYAGGTTKNPTYESIETGATGHAEAVTVYYDTTQIDYPTLVKIYFAGQDPTQVNGQGPDRGTQYRSVIFYRNEKERTIIEAYRKALQPQYKKPLAVEVMPFKKFWMAEGYHQNYIEHNPYSGYVQSVSIPEIKRLQKQYPALIKAGYVY